MNHSSANVLEELKQHRDPLLLAEVGALLHDMGKCTSEFVYVPQARSSDKLDPYKAVFRAKELSRYSFSPQRVQERNDEANHKYALHRLLDPNVLSELDSCFKIEKTSYSLREAIYFSRPRFAGHIGPAVQRLGEPLDLLAFCHGQGHVEKEEPLPSVATKIVSRYSPFGFKLDDLDKPEDQDSLTKEVNQLDFNRVTERSHFLSRLREIFGQALGDTRFPINEVTLWDWSYAVASLYKSELARHYLTGEWRERNQLRWRLLRINFDVLGLYAKAIRVADLLAYRRAVEDACEAVKKLVEEEYPLGNEVYRDTTGVYFTFPDIELPTELERKIRRCVEEIEPELAPHIRVESGEGENQEDQLKNLLAGRRGQARRELATPMAEENLSPYWQNAWESLSGGRWEICPLCRLRPKKEREEACEHCSNRRKSRVEAWKQDPTTTIWMDEIADHNGRVALIVGKFGLDGWLSGDLVQTLLVRAVENDPARCTPKNPSPARLRRVWETAQRFWDETVVDDLLAKLPDRSRWELFPNSMPDGLPEETVCDGTLDGRPISVWRAGDRFLTISYLPEEPSPGTLEVSWEVSSSKRRASCAISEAQVAEGSLAEFRCYKPFLPLVTSPDQFFALVPAGDTLELAVEIQEEYQKQFGKVQNRLPLFLGLVFFQRKMPLTAVMDTARRMLEQVDMGDENREIAAKEENDGRIDFTFRGEGREIEFGVPVKMGDDVTDDIWYPYFFFEGNPDSRKHHFQYGGNWLVHADDLREGDEVRLTPSRFLYTYLEHTAQRFRSNPTEDVIPLGDLPRLMRMWRALRDTPGMTDTKLQSIRTLLETKWQMWWLDDKNGQDYPERRETFKHLVEATFAHEKIAAVSADDVLDGSFWRCLDLYLHILRKRVEKEHG